jgi:hypothetical protein
MKRAIIKADRAVLNILTRYVRRWVAWHDNKKHVMDFIIQCGSGRSSALFTL